MPTVGVPKKEFYALYGEELPEDQLCELCLQYGIELEPAEPTEEAFKFEVGATRYDLLCAEGIARALRIFQRSELIPEFTSIDSITSMTVKPEVAAIRPYITCAILRGLTFTAASYTSFLDLQDKLHQNICRKRTLVAIGTHDLDTLEGPFTYEALPPQDIKFVPLNQKKEFSNAKELLNFYKADTKLKHYVPIIENSPVYPVLYDSKRRVLSLPPIINGAHSAISLKTKNVFIECTGTDLRKANTVLNTMVTMFSEYCENKFVVESVNVNYPSTYTDLPELTVRNPDLSVITMEVDLSYLENSIGIAVGAEKAAKLLSRMQLSTVADGNKLTVFVPPTRSDILHPCDVMENLAIAYGYSDIPAFVPKSYTQPKTQILNDFSDSLRTEVAMCGFTEVLNWVLLSQSENSEMICREHAEENVVVIANPKSREFEVARTSLLPGLLKVTNHNKYVPRPIKIFEVSDIVRLDSTQDVGAGNRRHLAALYSSSTTSGFEVIRWLLDKVMRALGVEYRLQSSEEAELIDGCQSSVFCNDVCVGKFGIIHPKVVKNFKIQDPCSYLELDMEYFL